VKDLVFGNSALKHSLATGVPAEHHPATRFPENPANELAGFNRAQWFLLQHLILAA